MMVSSCTCLTRCAISTEDVRLSGYLDRPPILTLHLHNDCDPPRYPQSLSMGRSSILSVITSSQDAAPPACLPSHPLGDGGTFLVPYTPYVFSPSRRIITSTAMDSFHTLEQPCSCRDPCQSGHRILFPSPSLCCMGAVNSFTGRDFGPYGAQFQVEWEGEGSFDPAEAGKSWWNRGGWFELVWVFPARLIPLAWSRTPCPSRKASVDGELDLRLTNHEGVY